MSVAGAATAEQGTATVSPAVAGPNANQMTVNLSIVADVQHLVVRLDGVQDSAGAVMNNLPARMDVLIGDTNGDHFVNSGDSTETRSRSGQLVNSNNFRSDVNTDGTVNSGDTIIVRSNSGHGF